MQTTTTTTARDNIHIENNSKSELKRSVKRIQSRNSTQIIGRVFERIYMYVCISTHYRYIYMYVCMQVYGFSCHRKLRLTYHCN